MSSDFHEHYEKEISPLTARIKENHLDYMRGSAIGGASVSLAILLLLTQIESDSVSLKVCLFSVVFCIPAWLGAWHFVESYIMYGLKSLGHFNRVNSSGIAVLFVIVGGLSLFVSISSLIWYLSIGAAIMFIISSFLIAFICVRHGNSVKRYVDEQENVSS